MDGLFNPQALRLVLKEWPLEDESIETHDDRTYVKKKDRDHMEDELWDAYPHDQNRADIITNLSLYADIYRYNESTTEQVVRSACAGDADSKRLRFQHCFGWCSPRTRPRSLGKR